MPASIHHEQSTKTLIAPEDTIGAGQRNLPPARRWGAYSGGYSVESRSLPLLTFMQYGPFPIR